jgi:hypothetical protein
MLRRVMLSCALSLGLAASASAGSIGPQDAGLPYGFLYSPSSSPFEAFEWTPLDFAAFSAYGGDFANVRRPVTPITFFEEPFQPPQPPGPDDELGSMSFLSIAVFEPTPFASSLAFEALPGESEGDPALQEAAVPEPGTLALIGLGLLGASARLRRTFKSAPR